MLKMIKKLLCKGKEIINNVIRKVERLFVRARLTVANQTGEGYVDTGVKILIAVVIGALLLAGLYALFNSTIMPTVTSRIQELFKYTGK